MACYGLLVLALSSTLLLQFDFVRSQTFVHACLGGNYTANSTYQANLSLLLSSIPNNTTRNNSIYYTNSVGRNPDRVYGLFQCRGDFSSEDCDRCARIAAEEIVSRCPYKKKSVIFFDECLLHYSNKSFMSTVQFEPTVFLYNFKNVSNPDQFNRILNALMDRLVSQAVSATNLFAIGESNLTTSQKIYGLAQCTQDLSPGDCSICLSRSFSDFPGWILRRQGGRVVRPSCNVRYEAYKFYQPRAPAPAPTQLNLPPNTDTTTGQEKKSSRNIIAIVVPTVIAAVLLSIVSILICVRRKKGVKFVEDVDEISDVESLQLNLATVAAATDNFSVDNKLGEGGFGPVTRSAYGSVGKISNGQEIAVKRLSKNSGQGVQEFKNEVLLLAKLQHRNLVTLLGFCLEGEEKLRIYEFVPNASLDQFIFDPTKKTQLDWERRYKIIGGIARGLLYLHEDSRVRIIHRDLKASNILLDEEVNPKISDFGMASLCVMDQTHGSTLRIVGTYGYMSPEYVRHGHFSVKSDVFSYGVLILEIISGKKNTSFFESEHAEDLLSYVWRLWEEGNVLELLEPALKGRYNRTEVTRCVHIGLLCVQEDVAKRPTMATVVLMLNSYSGSLALPCTPAFCTSFTTKNLGVTSEEHETKATDSSESALLDRSGSSSTPYSINEVSITELEPR